jgi:large subunit ribosomal protein L15
MQLHNLKPAKGSTHRKKRLGRGQGSGRGGTSTRGHKGAKSRSGGKTKRHYEGGQMPIQMRLPKRGFKNINRKSFKIINLGDLDALAKKYKLSKITPDELIDRKCISKKDLIKILGDGKLTQKLEVTAHAFSNSAKEAIEANGGSTIIVE